MVMNSCILFLGYLKPIIIYRASIEDDLVNLLSGETMLKLTVEQLARTLCANAVLGSPVDVGDRVIIPVAEFGFGFGGAEGARGDKEGGSQHGGAGTGGGGGVSAVAVIIITKDVPGPDGIQVVSLKKKSQLAEVITTLGETVGPHVAHAFEKGTDMMIQRKSKEPQATAEGTDIPVSAEEET